MRIQNNRDVPVDVLAGDGCGESVIPWTLTDEEGLLFTWALTESHCSCEDALDNEYACYGCKGGGFEGTYLRIPPGVTYEQVWDGRIYNPTEAPLECVHGEHQVACLRGEGLPAGTYGITVDYAPAPDAECEPADTWCVEFEGTNPTTLVSFEFEYPEAGSLDVVIE